MTIGASIFYIFIVVAIALIFWRIRTNPITKIRDGVINGDIRAEVNSISWFGLSTPLAVAQELGYEEMANLLKSYGAK